MYLLYSSLLYIILQQLSSKAAYAYVFRHFYIHKIMNHTVQYILDFIGLFIQLYFLRENSVRVFADHEKLF